MPIKEETQIPTPFEGFTTTDFAIFEIEGFANRMPKVREQIKPKLTQIGQALTESLSEIVGERLYTHVAQHLRRTVNPPQETWVAFSCAQRAYKPFVHLRSTIRAEKVRILVFVEDYADEKIAFAESLHKNAKKLAKHFAQNPEIRAYEILNEKEEPLFGKSLTSAKIEAFAERMQRVKGQHAILGIEVSRDNSIVQDGEMLLKVIQEATQKLKPLYALVPHKAVVGKSKK